MTQLLPKQPDKEANLPRGAYPKKWNRQGVCVCVCVFIGVYHRDLAQVAMEKFHMRTSMVSCFYITARRGSSSSQAERERERERERDRDRDRKREETEIPPFLCLFTFSMPSVDSKMPTHIEEGNLLLYSTDLNAHIIWKYPLRHLQKWCIAEYLGACAPVKLTHI